MKKMVLAVLLFYSINCTAVITGDSTILTDLKYLEYSSEDEKKYFLSYFTDKDSSALFQIFLVAYPKCGKDEINSATGKYNNFLTSLKSMNLNAKTEFDATKKIYNVVHQNFLKKYEATNTLCELFNNGNYNCVTASALYGFYLGSLHIPYTIKEGENHVYIVAYPNTKKILLETTNPLKGYFQYNQPFVKAFVEELYKNKLISDSEYNADINQTFNKYFFKAEDIDIVKLTGLQYYNLGIDAMTKEDYKTAFLQFQKAYFLYPSTKIRFLLKQALAYTIDKCKFQTREETYYLVLLSKFNTSLDRPFNEDVFKHEFSRLTHSQFISTGDTNNYSKSYRLLKDGIKDSLITNEIEFIYNYEIARAAINTRRKTEIEKNLDALYRLKPSNTDVQGIIMHYVSEKFTVSTTSKEAFETVNKYKKKYLFLEQIDLFKEVVLNCYLDFTAQQFSKNNPLKGEEYLNLFEKTFTADAESKYNLMFAERAYSEAIAFYFRKGNSVKAKALLKKGLVYAPESKVLENIRSSLY